MNVLMNYLKYVDRSQMMFDLLCYATLGGTYRKEVGALGGHCYVIDVGNHIGRIRSPLGQMLEQHTGQYSVAHLCDLTLPRFFHPVTRHHGVWSFAARSHATTYSDSRLWSLRSWLVCHSVETYSDARLACSRVAGDFLFGSGRFEMVPNMIGVEIYRFNESVHAEVHSRLGLGEAPIVDHVGRFSEQKSHWFLIDMCTELFRTRSDTRLMLIGDGPLRPGIEAVATEHGLSDCILFLGDRKDVPDLYQAVDMFLLPSPYEGLPAVGVETQYAGLPLMCSDEVTDEVTIEEVSFLPLDMPAPQWAYHVSQALDHGRNPWHRAKGKRATRVMGFDITHETERLTYCYRVLVE